MEITQGEPVPSQIQSALDQYTDNPLIGIEYTLELHVSGRNDLVYICVLCDKRADARTIFCHWCSLNHRVKYLEKRFPTVLRRYQPSKQNFHKSVKSVVRKLTEAIESFHGRQKVKVMDCDEFHRQRKKHSEAIMSDVHHNEKSEPSLLYTLERILFENSGGGHNEKSIDNLRNAQKRPFSIGGAGNESKSKVSKREDDLDAIYSESDDDTAKKVKSNTEQPPYTSVVACEEEQGENLPTSNNHSLQASNIAQERYKWETYRCMFEIQLKQMDKQQKEFEKIPEKHPLYPEEWKIFWNRRYKELQAEKNVDPDTYDYKTDWIIFWTQRMKDLFTADVEKKSKEIKLQLGLPEAEEKTDQVQELYKVSVNRATRQSITNAIDVSDDERTYSRNGLLIRSSRGTRSRSRSPLSNRSRGYHRRSGLRSRSSSSFSDNDNGHKSHRQPVQCGYNSIDISDGDCYKYSSSDFPASGPYRILNSSKISKYEDNNSKDSKDKLISIRNKGSLTVVEVLCLLTALEDHLGSLGPKVFDLLGKALALEKVKANSSDDLLFNEDHCAFFETIKEKLKGLLIAEVLEDQLKVRAVKRAIKNIAGIIHKVTKRSTTDDNKDDKRNEANGTASTSQANTKRKTNEKQNTPNLKDLPFDRQTIATKLAAALVVHGREDVSTEDMDKLIYLFILMVKISKQKREIDGKPVYCKNILPEFGIMPQLNAYEIAALSALPAIVGGLLENKIPAASKPRASTSRVSGLDPPFASAIDNDFELHVPTDNDVIPGPLQSLTDSDLQTLLQGFKRLKSEEQTHLIAYLEKLESVDPERAAKLRKYINLSDLSEPPGTNKSSTGDYSMDGNYSRGDRDPGMDGVQFSLSRSTVNLNEVFKATSTTNNTQTSVETSFHSFQNGKKSSDAVVSGNLAFMPAAVRGFRDTHNLIANLMSSMQQSNPISNNALNNRSYAFSAQSSEAVPPPPSVSNQQNAGRIPPQTQQRQQAHFGRATTYTQLGPKNMQTRRPHNMQNYGMSPKRIQRMGGYNMFGQRGN